MSLEPLSPETALEQYLQSRQHDATKSTIQNHRYSKNFAKEGDWKDGVLGEIS